MKIWLGVWLLIASTANAYASSLAVPEIDEFAGLAAMDVVGSIAALVGERRRRK